MAERTINGSDSIFLKCKPVSAMFSLHYSRGGPRPLTADFSAPLTADFFHLIFPFLDSFAILSSTNKRSTNLPGLVFLDCARNWYRNKSGNLFCPSFLCLCLLS